MRTGVKTSMESLDTGGLGRFSLRGKLFIDEGLRSANSVIIDGNYKVESVDTAQSRQRDIWLELVHDLTYLARWTKVVPAIAVAVQHRSAAVDDLTLTETTYKLGLLVEFE